MKELNVKEMESVNGLRNNYGAWGYQAWQASMDPIARAYYNEYRERRDRSGDAAARARSRSRSDMNSPGDQGLNDCIGGR